MPKSETDVRELRSDLRKCISEQVHIPEKVMEDILSRFHPKLLHAGVNFIEPGRICRKMAYIQSGILRMYNIADGKEITLWIGSRNRFITDLSSFINQNPSRWFIETIGTSQLLTISREQHYHLVSKYHDWIEFDNRLLSNAFTLMEQRMFSHLYMSAEERYTALFNSDPELFNQVPLKHIASMLGMTPETLSRLRAKQTS